MLVVCNKENSGYHLTKGKTYVVEYGVDADWQYGPTPYLVINDLGYQHYAEKNIFTPLQDLREKQINKILK